MNEQPVAKESFFARYLDPVDRLAEVIYGVLIVMTFTLSFRSIDYHTFPQAAASEMVRRLFMAAIGCVIAWGIIDAVMYILTSIFERADDERVVRTVHEAESEDAAVNILDDALDDRLLDMLTEDERNRLYRGLYTRYSTQALRPVGIERDDVYGALAIFALAVVATLPVALPFLISSTPQVAMRLSNLIAIAMLFLVGFRWAKFVYANPWKMGGLLALIGVGIVLIAIPLGG
jgi:VIT1/CCC1 family predicted Fe2+/Mn2+ transporter